MHGTYTDPDSGDDEVHLRSHVAVSFGSSITSSHRAFLVSILAGRSVNGVAMLFIIPDYVSKKR